jgi:hypothetical protein
MTNPTSLRQGSDKIAIPASMLNELRDVLERLDDILESIELLSDEQTMNEIKMSIGEIEKWEYDVAETHEDVDKLLK